MNPEEQNELNALVEHRGRCRIAWLDALSDFAALGRNPTSAEYTYLANVLQSLKVSQQRVERFTTI